MPGLIAAGAVLWRRPPDGGVEVAVVHRPRYDDWSWPKGKPAEGELLPATAVREVAEETGHTVVLGTRLGSTRYPVPAGEKVAHYWSARSLGGFFAPSDEVDELRWVPVSAAHRLLSYPHDRALLADLDAATAVTGTALLVRHAKAGQRGDWDGDDTLRPLTAAGQRQAEALRRLLPIFGACTVHTAPRTRCEQTVEGLAGDLGVPLVAEPLLSDDGYRDEPESAVRRLVEIVERATDPVVFCSQGEVIPDLVGRLAGTAGLTLSPGPPPSRKASFWVLSFVSRGRRSPVLHAADYYDDALA